MKAISLLLSSRKRATLFLSGSSSFHQGVVSRNLMGFARNMSQQKSCFPLQFSAARLSSLSISTITQHMIHHRPHPYNSPFVLPQQHRFIHSHYRRSRSSNNNKRERLLPPSTNDPPNPFAVLGLPQTPDTTYAAVKGRFLKIAMQNHPDTMDTDELSQQEQDACKEAFIRARQAFEAITAGPNGIAILASENSSDWKDGELNSWFKDHSGMDMPFLDLQTMQEVAKMTDEIGGEAGLDRDGGMWTLARMVSKDVKEGGDGSSILQLEAGKEKNRQIDGQVRRRRRR